ncbi:hypothetical protein K239x_44630 [Planctomycetes bacterium K23_9]|uniref:Uncharacterized protein n=1 Tax=Stieleria marina TaxID=1930275 RepID=A0A517NZD2_9BACT|nr:hypothetical protein K239x_44630 [Planctomycetes bacterium K23_9]
MMIWIDRILLLAIVVIVAVLTATALPVLAGHHLGGTMLLLHMMASGALVFALPAAAIVWLSRNINSATSDFIQRCGFWALIVTGFATIATVFFCMLPYPSTQTMHQLINWHGWSGFAMVPATVLLAIGSLRWRRIQATRSATPG